MHLRCFWDRASRFFVLSRSLRAASSRPSGTGDPFLFLGTGAGAPAYSRSASPRRARFYSSAIHPASRVPAVSVLKALYTYRLLGGFVARKSCERFDSQDFRAREVFSSQHPGIEVSIRPFSQTHEPAQTPDRIALGKPTRVDSRLVCEGGLPDYRLKKILQTRDR